MNLDGYVLLRRIGEGGFGQVWLAQSPLTNEFKALKLISGASIKEANRELQGLMAYKSLFTIF